MVNWRKQVRHLVVCVALTLVAAGAAIAEQPAWSGGWVASGLNQAGHWWAAAWGTVARTVGAATEARPHLDPDGTSAQPNDSDGLTDSDEPDDQGEARPHIDPNG